MAIDNETIITLVADIVSAHVSNNSVQTSELPSLISATYNALAGLGKEVEQVVDVKLEPAVSIRSSVKSDAITCLECGYKGKMLKRHLNTKHGLSPADYKARWSLPANYPMVAHDYAETRKELAVKIGLGRKPGQKRGRKPKA